MPFPRTFDAQPDTTARLEGSPPEEILRWTYESFRRVAIVASFQAESTVLIHMAAQIVRRPEVVTLDTGKLPADTLAYIREVQRRHPIRLHVEPPDPHQVAAMVRRHGEDLFYRSVELRRLCCEIRKVRPLGHALEGFDAWVTGLRRDQAASRRATSVLTVDNAHDGIAKIAPLVAWDRQRVWSYIRQHDLKHHPLYDRGYQSIGCSPCTRATAPGEDERAGRWWWEDQAVKECGLHRGPE